MYEILILCLIVCGIVGGTVYGTRELMLLIHAPEVYTWAVPLVIFFVIIGLAVKYAWREIV